MTLPSTSMVLEQGVPGPAIARLGIMPRVDLMPGEVMERKAFRRLQLGCAAALLACAVIVGSLFFQAHRSVQAAKKNLATEQAQQAAAQARVTALAPVAAAYNSVSAAQVLIASTLGGEVEYSNQMRILSTSVPAGIWFTSISFSPSTAGTTTTAGSTGAPQIGTVTFAGTAPSRDAIATWLETIGAQKGFASPTYSTSSETALNGAKYVAFSSTVSLTTPAESGRYTTAAER